MSDLLDKVLLAVYERIDELGFAVVSTELDDDLPLAYTVGLTAKDVPEIVTTGLSPQQSLPILGSAAEHVMALGPLQTDVGVPGFIENLHVRFTPVSSGLLYVARHIYAHSGVAAIQMVWPDPQGRFPHEPGYSTPLWAQRILQPRKESPHG